MNAPQFDSGVPALVVKLGHYPLHAAGLGAIRSLGRGGVPVYAITEDRFTPAARSRYCTRSIVAPTTALEREERLLDILDHALRVLPAPAVAVTTDDEAAVFLAEHRGEFGDRLLLPEVDPALPRTVASKRGLHAVCLEHGIPTPHAEFPASIDDVAEFARRARFPVVVKNVDPWERLREPVVGGTTVVESAADLVALARSWPEKPGVMLQDFVPPRVGDDWVFHGYFDAASTPLFTATGVKYRAWPPRYGVTTYGRVVANPRVEEIGVTLCRRIGFSGVVDLDIRYDVRDDTYKVVDFNPRVGAQFRLFESREGVDVVRALHLDLTGRAVPAGAAIEGVSFVVEPLDLPARLAYRRAGIERPSRSRARLEPAYFDRADPAPFVAMVVRAPSLVWQRIERRYGRARERPV